MARRFFDIKTLLRDIALNLLSTVVAGAAAFAATGNVWIVIPICILLFLIVIIYLLTVKYKRFISLLRAGVGFYEVFDLSENPKIWEEVRESFCYLGVSANSILEHFRGWISSDQRLDRYRFLLMDPESPALFRQIAFEKGVDLSVDLDSIDPNVARFIAAEQSAVKEAITSSIKILKAIMEKPSLVGKLEIRLHDEFIPWWMYVMDDKKILLGVLEKGKRGQVSPVMVLSRCEDMASPYEAMKNTWEKMWSEAREV